MDSRAENARRQRAENYAARYVELAREREAVLAECRQKRAECRQKRAELEKRIQADAEARRAAALKEWEAAHSFPEIVSPPDRMDEPTSRIRNTGGVVEQRVENAHGGVKADGEKPDMSLIPPAALELTAAVLTYGARKYAPDNWKKVEGRRYIAALLRHVCREMRDPGGVDEETGLPHVAHIGANAAILCGLYDEAKKGESE